MRQLQNDNTDISTCHLRIEELSKVLEPLEVATVFLSSDNNISLSTVLPVVHGLINQLDSDGDDSLSVKNFKEKVVTGLKQKWELDSISTTRVSVIATALDPRFRRGQSRTAWYGVLLY